MVAEHIHALEILIIDDDELDRKAIVRAIKQADRAVRITQATTAEEGLSMSARREFDVILLDYQLPDRDGIEVLRSLREGNLSSAAVVMISQHEDEELADQAIEAGAQDFLLKDEINARRLSRAVRLAQQRNLMEMALQTSHDELRKLAERDALTGLANRYTFERTLQTAVMLNQRRHGSLAVLLLDLNDFKDVNDTLGHHVGDELLIEVARRLNGVIRDSDFLARLGGDEFVVLAQDMKRDDQATLLANRIIGTFDDPFVFDGIELVISISIGIAVLGAGVDSSSELLKCADIGMYRAKKDGSNQYHFYSDQLHQVVRQRVNLERDLRQAVKHQQLRLYYQAQIGANDGTLRGMEALLRWEHPRQGMLLPGAFISLAEETGLIADIGEWVLRTACYQYNEWQSKLGLDKLPMAIAVNLSAVQLQGKDLLETVDNALTESGIDAGSLELEITENALISNPKKAVDVMSTLADRGVTFSLDDFGTGYSSFEHLKLMPIHALKIDRTFVSSVGKDATSERLLAAMIRFAKTLELRVVAEGVENPGQAQFCREKGCDLLQGYYYSKPQSTADFEAAFLSTKVSA